MNKLTEAEWSCPVCEYSVPPKSIKSERKHFAAHSLQCVRCNYTTETKSSWGAAIAAYNAPRIAISGKSGSEDRSTHEA